MAFEGLPVVIGWELTLACNLRCRHCGSTAGQARRKELTLEESLAICDQFPELLVQRVDFSGGEPLLNPNWAEIAAHLTGLGIRVEMITNGLGLSREVVEQMMEAGIPSIGVSIDGLEDTHNYIRGRKDAFQRSVEGMRRTREGGIVLTAMTTANALNIDELPHLFQLFLSLEVAAWQIQPVVPFGRSREASELWLSREDYLRLGDFIQEWLPHAEAAGMQLVTADSLGYFAEFETCPEPWRGCSAGLVGCAITSDGKVKGCLSIPNDFIEGDLRERDLWDIWFDPQAFAYTRQFTPAMLGPECRDCDRADECLGGCSSKSYGLTGRFHNDPLCYYKLGRGC
jgi:radical SAM protein with 4Fe4S-binding SPASM domain